MKRDFVRLRSGSSDRSFCSVGQSPLPYVWFHDSVPCGKNIYPIDFKL